MPQQTTDCEICRRIDLIAQDQNPYYVAELASGFVVIGDHQFFRGYSLLLCRSHHSELHQLSPPARQSFLLEMSYVAEAVFRAFRPQKLNYELLGNSLAHMHWHIFPRHADDPWPQGPVWMIEDYINNREETRPTAAQLDDLKTALLTELESIAPESIRHTYLDQGKR